MAPVPKRSDERPVGELPSLNFEVPIGEKLAVRVWSWKAPALESSAARDFAARLARADETGTARPTDYRISVFARARTAGQTTEQLFDGLIEHAKKHLKGAIRWIAPVMETELTRHEFYLELSEPPPDHHDIALGTAPENLRSQELFDALSTHGRARVNDTGGWVWHPREKDS